jgi:hypothetical protein
MFKDPNLYIPEEIFWAVSIPLAFLCVFIIVRIYYDKKEERKTKKKYDSYPKAYRSKVVSKELDHLLDFHEEAISN